MKYVKDAPLIRLFKTQRVVMNTHTFKTHNHDLAVPMFENHAMLLVVHVLLFFSPFFPVSHFSYLRQGFILHFQVLILGETGF